MDTIQIILIAAIVIVATPWLVLRARRLSAARETYAQALADALADGVLTPEEVAELTALQKKGALTATDVRAAGIAVYRDALSAAAEDARLTPDEDATLHRLQAQLGLTDEDLAGDELELARLRLLARIEGGTMPQVASPLQLIPDEACHWVVACSLAERLAVRSARTELHGITFDIADNEPFSASGDRSELRPAEDILPSDLGLLVITSRRTVFQGAKRTLSVPHSRLGGITLYEDGLRLDEVDPPARRLLLLEDPELAAAVLLQAARQLRATGRAPDADRS